MKKILFLLLLNFIFSKEILSQIEGWVSYEPKPKGKTSFAVQGWAISICQQPEVEIKVDGKIFWKGKPFFKFPGVKEKFPQVSGSDKAGFWVQINPINYSVGKHKIEVIAIAGECGSKKISENEFETLQPTNWLLATSYLFILLFLIPFLLSKILLRIPLISFEKIELKKILIFELFFLIIWILLNGNFFDYVVGERKDFFSPLANWDGQYYLMIAKEWYTNLSDERAYAYFPLYPLLLKIFSFLPIPLPILGSILNSTFFFFAICFLSKIYNNYSRGLLFYFLSPFAFFFSVAYSEGTFLLCASAFLYYIKKENHLMVTIFGILCGISRPNGILLSLFSLEAFKKKNKYLKGAIIFSPFIGLIIWTFYLWIITGDPLKFLHSQKGFGRVIFFHPGIIFDKLLQEITIFSGMAFWEMFFLYFVLLGSFALIRKKRYSEGFYSLGIILQPLAILSFPSLNRYALASFPVFIFFGNLIKNKILFYLILLIEISLLLYFSHLFSRQIFVG